MCTHCPSTLVYKVRKSVDHKQTDDVITRHAQYSSEPRVIHLSLPFLLAFTNPPSDLIVAQGSPARFDCVFTTSTSVSISWEKDGATITPVGRFSYLVNNSLLISATQAGDNGTYTCVVADQSSQQRAERSASLTFACKEFKVICCVCV